MKITILKQMGIAMPEEEGSVQVEANKIFAHCYDAKGNLLEAKVIICGRTFGTESGIPMEAIEEGTNRLYIEYDGARYPSAYLIKTGSYVAVHMRESYGLTCKACVVAEEAIETARSFAKRIDILEKAYSGVDLMDLS